MLDSNECVPARLEAAVKRYRSVTALDGVSFDVRPGELVTLLGPNGAGKTTAVRLLLGLARADAGRATLFGRDPRVAAHRIEVGAMLQVGKVPETLTVAEHVALFSSYYPHPRALDDVLRSADLDGVADRRFGELSGGQKQRVLFALALCGNPRLLVLDEPTLGLDVEARRGLWDEVRRYVAEGGSVLLTTHYLAEAEAVADRIVVLAKGRVVADGDTGSVKAAAGLPASGTLEDAYLALTRASSAKLEKGVA